MAQQLDISTDPKDFEFLVKWKGYPLHDATWEPYNNLANAPNILNEYITAKCLPDHWRLPEFKDIGDKDIEEKEIGDKDQEEEETEEPDEEQESKKIDQRNKDLTKIHERIPDDFFTRVMKFIEDNEVFSPPVDVTYLLRTFIDSIV